MLVTHRGDAADPDSGYGHIRAPPMERSTNRLQPTESELTLRQPRYARAHDEQGWIR